MFQLRQGVISAILVPVHLQSAHPQSIDFAASVPQQKHHASRYSLQARPLRILTPPVYHLEILRDICTSTSNWHFRGSCSTACRLPGRLYGTGQLCGPCSTACGRRGVHWTSFELLPPHGPRLRRPPTHFRDWLSSSLGHRRRGHFGEDRRCVLRLNLLHRLRFGRTRFRQFLAVGIGGLASES